VSTVRSSPLPSEPDNVEDDDDRESEPGLEESNGDLAGGHLLVTRRPDGNEELCDSECLRMYELS
jgi:hypothetical protein